jgi:hypothetical protein
LGNGNEGTVNEDKAKARAAEDQAGVYADLQRWMIGVDACRESQEFLALLRVNDIDPETIWNADRANVHELLPWRSWLVGWFLSMKVLPPAPYKAFSKALGDYLLANVELVSDKTEADHWRRWSEGGDGCGQPEIPDGQAYEGRMKYRTLRKLRDLNSYLSKGDLIDADRSLCMVWCEAEDCVPPSDLLRLFRTAFPWSMVRSALAEPVPPMPQREEPDDDEEDE